MLSNRYKIPIVTIILAAVITLFVFSTGHRTVDFSTEVKPILNNKCIACHGGVKKQAGFSLLFREEALAKTRSGKYAIVPGDPESSEMIRRLHLKDPEERMPYQKEPLSEDEIETLTRWIKQGAKWGEHWAYKPVTKQELPGASAGFLGLFPEKKSEWARNDIDHFIYDKIKKQSLHPSPEADRATLLRRVSLDLTGLPPSDSLARAFLKNEDPQAYEQLVDTLLASPQYGERWTALWLDLARYADTKGYERDAGRTIWRYRDWLIKAFNMDKPYNDFLTEQLAGDLLPDPSEDHFIATAFHRNTMTNDEGGTENEEYRAAAVIDRVNTTWETLQSTTFSCVQCHSHPYDPFRHEDYYKFMAFFNNSRDEDTYADYPVYRHFDSADEQRLKSLKNWMNRNAFRQEGRQVETFLRTWQPAINSNNADSFNNAELSDTKWLAMRSPSQTRFKNISFSNFSQLLLRFESYQPNGILTIRLDSSTGTILKQVRLPQTKGWTIMELDFPPTQGKHDVYLQFKNPSLKDPETNATRFDWFYFTQPFPGKGTAGYENAYNSYRLLLNRNPASTPIMMENPAEMYRPTYVFERGNWLMKGEEVTVAVPAVMNPFPANAPRNRLGLAMWMTDKKNPLTARTMVNRLWEQLFGTGLVETLEDMGTQGAEPTHKELLDHLSYTFMHDFKWSMKKLLKQMVMSATYRQQSFISPETLVKDPLNRYYARGPRFRLSAEQLRDQALAVSGLLSKKMYGPSVMPWQPEGIWKSPWSNEYWLKSKGEDQYRRAIYTNWKRTAPFPSMITYDGVGREVCVSRRIRTNTPLQALAMLNDSVYLEAARELACTVADEAGSVSNSASLITTAYRHLQLKPITPKKLEALQQLYVQAYQRYAADKKKTNDMMGGDKAHNNPETAALTVVTNAMFNLDEFVTKN
jgi:hypothetical protein